MNLCNNDFPSFIALTTVSYRNNLDFCFLSYFLSWISALLDISNSEIHLDTYMYTP